MSSEYFPPTINHTKDTINKYILKDAVPKDLYIYFIGYKSDDNVYKPNSQVIDFLNKCAKEIDKDSSNPFSKDDKWKIKSLERDKIKEIRLTKNNSNRH